MKKLTKCLICVLLAALLCIDGCGKKTERVPDEPDHSDTQQEKDPQNEGILPEDPTQETESGEEPEQETAAPVKTIDPYTLRYYIKVNKKANVVTVYEKDQKGEYTVPVRAMLCSCGGANTPSGKFNITGNSALISDQRPESWWWGLWGEVNGKRTVVYGQYCTQIKGDILFHSEPYLIRGAHDSLQDSEYDKLGTTCSHGCIRLQVGDAKWIYNNRTSIGIVEIYESADPGPLGKPVTPKIGASRNHGWDPTDPDSRNPWNVKTTTVGFFVGMSEEEAIKEARWADLSVSESVYVSSSTPRGTVLEQSLTADSTVDKSTAIRFTVSSGTDNGKLPNYMGFTEAAAREAIKALGMTVVVHYEESAAVGVVLYQTPAAGSDVVPGGVVELAVGEAVQEEGDPEEGDPEEGDPEEGNPEEGDPGEDDPGEGDPGEGEGQT